MNIGEANAVNDLLAYVTRQHVDRDRLQEAGALLARGAHKALMAGTTEEGFRALFGHTHPDNPVEGCPRCLIENKRCARHCDPITCPDPDHGNHLDLSQIEAEVGPDTIRAMTRPPL